ncbi:MAG: peptidase domain-containing ABC transporter [Planctomycetota bacterium]
MGEAAFARRFGLRFGRLLGGRFRRAGPRLLAGWRRFPLHRQLDQMDCGPTCLRMIAEHHGRRYEPAELRRLCAVDREGTSLLHLSRAAEAIGLRAEAGRVDAAGLKRLALPCILHWSKSHYVVLYRWSQRHVWLADPVRGRLRMPMEHFLDHLADGAARDAPERPTAVVLALEPGADFGRSARARRRRRGAWAYVTRYLRRELPLFLQLGLGILLGVLFSFFPPFLTQAIVDSGIGNRDVALIHALLLALLMLFAGQTAVRFLRAWILVHVGSRVNLSIVSDFLQQLVRLPLSFFQQRIVGDVLQRIRDHDRVETFLTTIALDVLFSSLSLLLYSVVLAFYSGTLLLIFAAGSLLSLLWTLAFASRRRRLDQRRFGELADEHSVLVQLVAGMREIKLYGAEQQRLQEWGGVQARIFNTRLASLSLGQTQEGGALAIHELKNILLTFVSAQSVIDGDMSLGMMMAVQYILGQLNLPVGQFLGFTRAYQDANMSLERLVEVRDQPEEDSGSAAHAPSPTIRPDAPLVVRNLSFRYDGGDEDVLRDVSFEAPPGALTAIVGSSGSGKTTLLKLLLKVGAPTRGSIRVGSTDLQHAGTAWWRGQCGTVLQDGYIFADTIERNIALGEGEVDPTRLRAAARAARIDAFIEALPQGYRTRIGARGEAMSSGQRQRILIARAVYRSPRFLLFDEATSALDAETEREVMGNLRTVFRNRTAIVVAHRLSTVREARQILVLEKGRIVERGDHRQLVARRGRYYALVKNQLELDR